MKKILFLVMASSLFSTVFAQEKNDLDSNNNSNSEIELSEKNYHYSPGIKAGFSNVLYNFEGEGESFSGFYVGWVGEFFINEKYAIQPEVLYSRVEESNFVYIPILLKINVAKNINLVMGPQMNYILDDFTQTSSDDSFAININSFGLDLTFGAEYEVTENIFIDARYGYELTNRITSDSFGDFKFSINTLHIGGGYRF